jgi:nitric oxide reductase activation protein
MQLQRPPGYPKLTPELRFKDASPLEAVASELVDERERQHQVKSHSVYVRVLVNGKQVQLTSAKPFNSEFEAQFDETFKLHLHQRPSEIRFNVYVAVACSLSAPSPLLTRLSLVGTL